MKSIHFVCRGNVYRSRMAEAYIRSISNGKLTASSSGVQAYLALNGNVDPEAVKYLKAEKMDQHLSANWHQITQEDIDNNDTIVFMSQTVYDEAKKTLKIPKSKTVIWNIPDIDGVFSAIKVRVDELIKSINQ